MRNIVAALIALGLVACEPLPGTGNGTTTSASSGSSSGTSGTPASGGQAIDTQKLCTRLVDECGQALTKPECVKSFGSLRVTAACIDGIAKATCAELGAANSSVLTTCFPPCSGNVATCNTDGTLTLCTLAGTSQVSDCGSACAAEGSSWSGTCGTTFGAQTAERPQCWCK